MRATPGIGGKARVLGELRLADRRHQAAEDRVGIAGNAKPFAVGTQIGVAGGSCRDSGTRRLTNAAVEGIFGKHTFHQAEHGIDEINVDYPPPPAADQIALIDGGQHAQRSVEARKIVGHGNAAPGRRQVCASWITRKMPYPAHRLADRAERGFVAVRAVLTVTRDARNDEPRVQRMEPRRPKPKLFQLAGAEVFNQNIGARGELFSHGSFAFEIKLHRKLVAAVQAEPDGMPVLVGSPATNRIPARRFHLDDLRAEIRKQPSTKRAGNIVAELQNFQPDQGSDAGWRFQHFPLSEQIFLVREILTKKASRLQDFVNLRPILLLWKPDFVVPGSVSSVCCLPFKGGDESLSGGESFPAPLFPHRSFAAARASTFHLALLTLRITRGPDCPHPGWRRR